MSAIDPIRLAQFMVLPGAAELVEAFSAIPPGPLRDSIVHHAMMLAQTAGWQPTPEHAARVVGVYPPAAPRLASPFAEGLSSTSAEGQIVERVLRGEDPDAVAVDMGVRPTLVKRLMATARREGGVVFPGDDDTPRAAKTTKTAGKRAKPHFDRFPVPAPPYWWEDPASPIWNNPSILPTFSEDAKGSLAAIGPLDRRMFATMANAAARKGLTLQGLIARRYEILAKIDAGQTPTAISLEMRITPYDVYGLLQRVGRSRRMDELTSRPMMPENPAQEAAKPPAAVMTAPEPLRPLSAFPPPAQAASGADASTHAGAQYQKQAAAERWGFPSVARFEDMRKRVRDLRSAGWHPMWIAKEVGMSRDFVKATIQYWRRERGITFPPAPYRTGAKAKVA
jgi:hypothetical protein